MTPMKWFWGFLRKYRFRLCLLYTSSAVQCVQFLKAEEQPIIRTAVTYLITGDLTDEEFDKIKAYCINPVDSRETGMEKPKTLVTEFAEPADVRILDGFTTLDADGLKQLYDSLGLAMTLQDFKHIQKRCV